MQKVRSKKGVLLIAVLVFMLVWVLAIVGYTISIKDSDGIDIQESNVNLTFNSPSDIEPENEDFNETIESEALTLIHPEGSFKDLTMDIPKDWRQEFTDGVNQILILSKGSVELEIVRGNIEGYECIASDKSARQGVFGLEYNQSEVEVMNTEIGEIFLIPNPRTIEAEVSDYYVCTSAPSDKGDFDWTLTDYGVFSISVKNNGSNDDYLDALEIIQSFR